MTDAIDVLDLSDPSAPTLVLSIAIADPTLAGPTSVAVHDGVVAAAVPSATAAQPGQVLFFDVDGTPLAAVTVGALHDMLHSTHGQKCSSPTKASPGTTWDNRSGRLGEYNRHLGGGAENVVQAMRAPQTFG